MAARAPVDVAGAAPAEPWGTAPGPPDVWPTPAQQDLLRATLLPDERALAAWRRIRRLMNVAEMDGTVGALLPQLRVNLVALGCEDSMLELFKGVHRHTWARNQLLLAQAMPVVGALEAAGIRTLLLKGAALLADGRHEGGVRPMTDVDVLVDPQATETALEVLQAHGMSPTDGSPTWYAVGYGQRYRNSWNFQNPDGGQLDLHWHALHWCRHPLADADLWTAAELVALRGIQTRALCPADELLMAIAHGLRWDPKPTYRWVLDAALASRSPAGSLDWDRLVAQARRRRLHVLVRSGLLTLSRLAGVEVPADTLRALRSAAPLQRLELRTQVSQPRRRSAGGQAVSLHLWDVRRSVAPGGSASITDQLRILAQRAGVRSVREIPRLRKGGIPGPGRPVCETFAPIGTGTCAPPPVAWGNPLELGIPETARDHCLYGLWPPEPDQGFAWIAGREALLAVQLPEPVDSSLLLTLAAGSVEHPSGQRLHIAVRNATVGEVAFRPGDAYRDQIRLLIPPDRVAGRSRLEIRFRSPDAITPARLGLNDDLRLLGVNLHRLTLRTPARCARGERLRLGHDAGDERFLAEGWGEALATGRLTRGSQARLVLRPPADVTGLEWEGQVINNEDCPGLKVEVSVNGWPVGVVDPGYPPQPMRMPLSIRAGELLISWRIVFPGRGGHAQNRRTQQDHDPTPELLLRSVTIV